MDTHTHGRAGSDNALSRNMPAKPAYGQIIDWSEQLVPVALVFSLKASELTAKNACLFLVIRNKYTLQIFNSQTRDFFRNMHQFLAERL